MVLCEDRHSDDPRPVAAESTCAALGMHFKLDSNKADFTNLGLTDVALDFTASGHPCAEAVSFSGQSPTWPEKLDWSVTEIHIPERSVRCEAYTVSAATGGVFSLFYPKIPVLSKSSKACEGISL